MSLQQEFTAAYDRRNLVLAVSLRDQLLTLVSEVDMLLASNSRFLLGSWIESARSWATSEEEARLFDFNARNLVTLWGPNGEITDYASKSWAKLA